MKKIIVLLFSLVCAQGWAKTSPTIAYVEIRPDVKLYVEHLPAAPGRPTVILLNGLTYSTRQWAQFVRVLHELDSGIGIVAYDMRGMGNTLLKKPNSNRDRNPVERQAEDLHLLFKALNIPGPVSVAGLSYGGAVASVHSMLYPDDFENYIHFAPMIERLPEQDALIKGWVAADRMANPFDPRNDDEIYDDYLRNWIYSTYPAAEPIILENPYKLEAVFRMVQGVKNWNAIQNSARFPKGKFHLVAAAADEHVKLERLQALWNGLPADVGQSFMRLSRSKHKIPELFPRQLAVWTVQILNGNPHLQRGLTFDGDPEANEARSGDIRIPLNHISPAPRADEEVICEQTLLRTVP